MDIGKGDVVVAVREMHVAPIYTGRQAYTVPLGTRATVAQVTPIRSSICPECGDSDGPGLLLEEYPLILGIAWCQCEWKRFGGSKDDHVAWFAGYLKDKVVADAMKRLLGPPGRTM